MYKGRLFVLSGTTSTTSSHLLRRRAPFILLIHTMFSKITTLGFLAALASYASAESHTVTFTNSVRHTLLSALYK